LGKKQAGRRHDPDTLQDWPGRIRDFFGTKHQEEAVALLVNDRTFF
jgi:hypothetical protein